VEEGSRGDVTWECVWQKGGGDNWVIELWAEWTNMDMPGFTRLGDTMPYCADASNLAATS
jgi:hypothetical protein